MTAPPPAVADARAAMDDAAHATAMAGQRVPIGQAAQASGISPKMLRHYESLGLLGEVARTGSGYRQYSPADIHILRFIRRGRDLGFTLAEIADLLKLWQDRSRASADVKRIAQAHVEQLNARIDDLLALRATLQNLLNHCHGDSRPDCPILDELAAGPDAANAGPRPPAACAACQPQAPTR